MSAAYIYGLVDPITDQLRYVGKSVNPKKRLTEHLRDSKRGKRSYCCYWIKSLVAAGATPEVIILEECDSCEWSEPEQYWIGYMRMIGANLTNITLGGHGANNWPLELRRQRGDALRGKPRIISSRHREKIIEANKARSNDPQWKEKIRISAIDRHKRNPDRLISLAALGRKMYAASGPFQKTCNVCGADFVSKTKPGKFCSAHCRSSVHGKKYRERQQAIKNASR